MIKPHTANDDGQDNPDIDLPWVPPVHIAGVIVPVAAQEPRVGVRLANGTRLGHRPHHDPAPPAEGPTVWFSQTQGTSGGLRSVSSWWAHPVPEDGYFGWSGPFSTGAHGSSLAMTFDDEPDPKGE